MPKLKMTTVSLERLKLPAEGQIDYFDAAYPGLALRLTPTGVRSWVYFGRVDGRLKRATLGRYPGMSLAEARRAAASMAEAMRAGIDPATAKRRARAATVRDSFAAVTAEWLKRDQADNRSHDDTKRIMGRYPLPVLAAGNRGARGLVREPPQYSEPRLSSSVMATLIDGRL